MIIDARSIPSGASISSEICIIGAGPAAMTLANEFLETGCDVVLLESGGLGKSKRAQKLSAGALSGELYEPLENTHLRQVGGTANHWIVKMADSRYGYRFAPMTPMDFKPRSWVKNSGWPISAEELQPYYDRAHEICGMPGAKYGEGEWRGADVEPLPFDPDTLITDYFCFASTDVFTKDIPRRIKTNENIRLYYNATVVELIEDETENAIRAALVRQFDGREISFEARYFIVACGGLQTPRLLLASRRKHPEGIGNEHDVVGRDYMDHSIVPSGNFYAADTHLIDHLAVYDMRLQDGVSVLGKLSFSEAQQEKHALRNITFTLFPMPSFERVAAMVNAKELYASLRHLKIPDNLGSKLMSVIRRLPFLSHEFFSMVFFKTPLMPGFGRGGWSLKKDKDKDYERLELLAFVEQSPDPENRVTLTDDVDELRTPRIKAHFKWPEGDIESISRAQALAANAFDSLGIGKFAPDQRPGQPFIDSLGLHHIMGTTRMGDDPRTSVVDKDCKVHGTRNLFIASSSVFPTSGYANPTLSIMALAIRVADTVKALILEIPPL